MAPAGSAKLPHNLGLGLADFPQVRAAPAKLAEGQGDAT
jgi:hypothetical protein